MRFEGEFVQATLVRRVNRFLALAEIEGKVVPVHVPNSGRLRELMVPGYRIYMKYVERPGAKTSHDLALVDLGSILVSADARLPNRLLREAITQKYLLPFTGYDSLHQEVVYGNHRLDFMLSGESGRCLIEAKSITLVENEVGLFPDAPTVRGAGHMRALARAKGQGYRAAVVFVIQRPDAERFSPNDRADPAFGRALRQAVSEGVEAYAYRCKVNLEEIELDREVPVAL